MLLKMDAGSKRNNAGGFWVAGFAKTSWRASSRNLFHIQRSELARRFWL